jgi:hypothetical protein
MLRFPDETRVSVTGLNEILGELYSEGRKIDQETAKEIVRRLEKNNFIPSSERIRSEYRQVLLAEYRDYVDVRAGEGTQPPVDIRRSDK